MLYDLNVAWPTGDYNSKPSPTQLTNLFNTISTLYSFGYTKIAINFTINETVKIPINNANQINPIMVGLIDSKFPKERYPELLIFTRLTLVISEPSRVQALSKINSHFDLIAIQPTSEKALQLSITNLDIDIISFNLNSRLPFFIKHKTICSAINKGIKFEINYSGVLSGSAGYTADSNGGSNTLVASASQLRRNWFNNVLQLIRASRERGLIISSGANQPLQVRNYTEILTLLNTLGLPNNKGKTSITQNSEACLINGRLRIKSYKQTIVIGNTQQKRSLYENELEDKTKKNNMKNYKKIKI